MTGNAKRCDGVFARPPSINTTSPRHELLAELRALHERQAMLLAQLEQAYQAVPTPLPRPAPRLTARTRRLLRALLPKIAAWRGGESFLVADLFANSAQSNPALAAALTGLNPRNIGAALGRAADCGPIDGYTVFREDVLHKTQIWAVEQGARNDR